MTDYENEETQGFKVSDKRRFSPDGATDQPEEHERENSKKRPLNRRKRPRTNQQRKNVVQKRQLSSQH